jgi:hypothetical protein
MQTFSSKQNQAQMQPSSSVAQSNASPSQLNRHTHPVLRLQSTIGNQAVSRMLQNESEQPKAGWTGTESVCSLGNSMPAAAVGMIQTKLAVNQPGDKYELEADRISDQVLTAPAPAVAHSAPPQIQRFSEESSAQMDAAPASVDHALASSGQPLEPALRQDMEQRLGQDFSQVRVHNDATSEKSARHVNAHAYTRGYDIVFGAGRFAPATVDGRRLLAHELTHVVQQTQGDNNNSIQRDVAENNEFLAPDDLVEKYENAIDQKLFGGLARLLVDAIYSHPTPYQYVTEVFEAIHDYDSDLEDDLGAEFINQLPSAKLDQMAKAYDGRYTLTVLYEAIMTGDVTAFQREQGNKVLMAKARAYDPADYVRLSRFREEGKRTRIFPVRFMRVTPGYDYAPPLARLMPNGKIRVSYPVAVMTSMPMFKAEVDTLEAGFFNDRGEEINPNEIVGIKDYESGGAVLYLPALALIDYSNQAIHSTAGKIAEVAIFAATMGFGGGGAAAGGGVAATEVRMTAIWAARLSRAASMLERVADLIGIASFIINENREWIISKLGKAGERLVQISNIANSVADIYGFVRLGQAGYAIARDLRTASNAARQNAKRLTLEEDVVLRRLDDEADAMVKELDEAAAKGKTSGTPGSAQKPAKETLEKGTTKMPKEQLLTSEEILVKEQAVVQQKLKEGKITPVDKKWAAKGYDFEVKVEVGGEKHTYRHEKTEGTWCRYSDVAWCGHALGPEADRAIAAARQARRPSRTGKETEQYVEQFLGPQFESQQRFFEGDPTGVKYGMSITDFNTAQKRAIVAEVKNIDIERELRLRFANLRAQTGKYLSNIPHPVETRFWLFLDIRGQRLSQSLANLAGEVKNLTGNVYDHVMFVTEIGVVVF